MALGGMGDGFFTGFRFVGTHNGDADADRLSQPHIAAKCRPGAMVLAIGRSARGGRRIWNGSSRASEFTQVR